MKLDSKSLPFYAGAFVLVVAGVFLIGRRLIEPATAPTTITLPTPASAAPQPASPVEREARDAVHAGQPEEAIALLERVPEADPGYLSARLLLGVLYERTDRPADALTSAETILMQQPEDAEAHYIRCRALYQLGRLEDAEGGCLRAVEIAPAHVGARYALGLIRLARGRADRAIEAYLRAMSFGREPAPVLDALRDLTELQEQRPQLAEVHYAMAFFAGALGNHTEEIAELERYLAAVPAGPVADAARRKLEELKR